MAIAPRRDDLRAVDRRNTAAARLRARRFLDCCNTGSHAGRRRRGRARAILPRPRRRAPFPALLRLEGARLFQPHGARAGGLTVQRQQARKEVLDVGPVARDRREGAPLERHRLESLVQGQAAQGDEAGECVVRQIQLQQPRDAVHVGEELDGVPGQHQAAEFWHRIQPGDTGEAVVGQVQ